MTRAIRETVERFVEGMRNCANLIVEATGQKQLSKQPVPVRVESACRRSRMR